MLFLLLILFNRHPLEDLETDRFLLRPPKLVELARCAHPDFDRVGFEAPVLRLRRLAGPTPPTCLRRLLAQTNDRRAPAARKQLRLGCLVRAATSWFR
jgi:hypothetical protein